MNDIICLLIGFFSCLIVQKLSNMNKDPEIVQRLTIQIEKLEERLDYYKNLCLWHVQEKDKMSSVIKELERKK